MSILDLGDDGKYLKVAKILRLGELEILPICMGCDDQIKEGEEYFTNSSGALTSHKNEECQKLAKQNQLRHMLNID